MTLLWEDIFPRMKVTGKVLPKETKLPQSGIQVLTSYFGMPLPKNEALLAQPNTGYA